MSGIVSGITKVFSSVGSAVARVGSAVAGVGASVFTSGAASGAGSMASGGLSSVASGFGGTLGKVLTGAISQAAIGAVIGGGISALTGNGFGKGALMGGLAGAATGGLTGLMSGGAPAGLATDTGLATAATPTGLAPVGKTASAPSSIPGKISLDAAGDANLASRLGDQSAGLMGGGGEVAAAGGGLGSFLTSETGGNILSGLGDAYGKYADYKQKDKQLDMQAEEYDKDRAFKLDQEMRIRDSYAVDPSVLHGPASPDTTARPTPAQAYGRTRYEYDPSLGRVVSVAA